MSSEIKHAWYSAKSAEQNGTIRYRTVDGDVVHVTSVSNSCHDSGTAWDDVTYLGKVDKWMGRGYESEFVFHKSIREDFSNRRYLIEKMPVISSLEQQCSECNGSGEYVGFNVTVEQCQACKGTGKS